MTTARWLLLATFVLSGCARSGAPASPTPDRLPDDPSAPLPIDPRVRSGVLDNGLTWYVEPNLAPGDRAQLRLAVQVGSVVETDDQLGYAHIVEHMAFNGTEHFPGNDLVAYLESVGTGFGTHINAYTSYDETVYKLQVPTDDPTIFANGLLALRDWAGGIAFEDEECEKERGVLLEEWRLQQGVQQRVQDFLMPLTLHGSRYLDRPVIGSEDSLATFTCDGVEAFWETWYRPELMAVMVVGDVDVDATIRAIRKLFGELPAQPDAPARPTFQVPDHEATLAGVYRDPEIPQTVFSVQDKVDDPEGDDHAAYRLFLLEQLVYLAFNERLGIAGQAPTAPWLAAFSSEQSLGRERAAQTLQIVPKPGREEEALAAGLVELERMRRHGITTGELQRARDALASLMQSYFDERDATESGEHVEELLRVYLTGEAMPGIPYEYRMAQAYLPDITVDEANAFVGSDLFSGSSRVMTALLPADGPAITEDDLLAVAAEVDARVIAPPADEEATQPLMTELPTAGAVTQIDTDDVLGTSTWRLANGATLVLKPTAFKEDEIQLQAFSAGGMAKVEDDDSVPAATAVDLVQLSGVGDLDAVALAKTLAGRDVSVQPTLTRFHESMSAAASGRDLETMLQLAHLTLAAPRFDPDALTRLREAKAAGMKSREVSPDARFEDRWTALVWSDDPRTAPWRPADLEALDLARSEAIYRDRFGDVGDWTFVIVGSFESAAMVPLAARYLGSLPATDRDEAMVDDGSRRVDGVIREEMSRGSVPRGRVRLQFHAPFAPNWESRGILSAATQVLETRLLQTLREDLGGTYVVGAWSSTTPFPEGEAVVTVEFECDPARIDELVAATWDVIGAARQAPPEPMLVEAVKEKARRRRETALASNGWWADALAGAMLRGEDPVRLASFPARNDAITPIDIQRVSARVLDPANVVQVVLRPDPAE